MGLKEEAYHVIVVVILLFYFWRGFWFFVSLKKDSSDELLSDKHFDFVDLIACFKGVLVFLALPFNILNVMGIILLNPFNEPQKQAIGDNVPFVCFRVVTKGLFPKLVKDTTFENLNVCRRVGLKNFKFEIVTDKAVGIGKTHDIREIVVPEEYQTRNNALYKARALQWSMEPAVNILSNNDWIVHLDEETKLTDGVIHGIIHFITKSSADFGQGVIVYADDVIQNWVTTLADGMRVAFDYGAMRFGLQILNRPMFGFKGSFIVAKVKAEKDVGFDFCPNECIAEDLRFALTAWHKGYKFDFVHGTMVEKSAFSLLDFIRQRKRWFIGHYHIIWNNSLPIYCKLFLLPLNIVNFFIWVQFINEPFVPVNRLGYFLYIMGIVVPSVQFSYGFGNYMSFRRKRIWMVHRIFLVILSQVLMPVAGILEGSATVWGFLTRNNLSFHIVKKENFVPDRQIVQDV